MTVKELRAKLFEIQDQDQDVFIYVKDSLSGILDLADEIDLEGGVYLQTEAQ